MNSNNTFKEGIQTEKASQNQILKEVELRLTFGNEEQSIVLESKLQSHGFEFHSESTETDTYFDGPNFIEDKVCLRVRKRGDFVEMTYKGPSRTKENGFFSKEELNLKIEDPETAFKMLSALGFPELVTVSKNRKTYKRSVDNTGIMIDRIEEVGVFLEIEVMSNDPTQARRQILQVQKDLELTNLERTVLPYRDLKLNSISQNS